MTILTRVVAFSVFLAWLASNGNLVKRPFVVTGSGGCVGFDETEWSNAEFIRC